MVSEFQHRYAVTPNKQRGQRRLYNVVISYISCNFRTIPAKKCEITGDGINIKTIIKGGFDPPIFLHQKETNRLVKGTVA